MKIIHYMGSLNFGGIETLVHDLVSVQKINPELTPSILVGKSKGFFLKKFQRLNVKIDTAQLKTGYDFSPKKIYSIYKLFSLCDIIHLHSFHIAVAFAALLSGRPIVYTEHGNFAFGRRRKWTDYINHYLRKCLFKFSSCTIICNSNFTKQKIINYFSFSSSRLKVIYNGSDVNKTVDRKKVAIIQSSIKDNFIIGTTSRLAGVKRVDRLINVFNLFSKNHPNTSLIIVGDGPEKTNLMRQARESDYKDKIIFLGYKSNVIDYQAACDVCIFPSQNEPFGLVAVESYIAKKPVLVFKDAGGLCEIVSKIDENDICGNATDMINRLTYYYENKGLEKNFTRILSIFNVERMENQYFEEYKKIISCAE